MDPMNMECAHVRNVLARYSTDPAAAIPDTAALHLDRCPACRRVFDVNRIGFDPAVFETLPTAKRLEIIEALAATRSGRTHRRAVVAMAVAAAAIIVLAGVVGLQVAGRGKPAVTVALVEDHIRYLHDSNRQGALADPVTLIAELEDHVDFPVRLPALPESRLTGGRRCYLLDRRVALSFYDTPTGPVSYFVLAADRLPEVGKPCDAHTGLRCSTLKGYRVVSWQESGLLHAVVGPDAPTLDAVAEAAR